MPVLFLVLGLALGGALAAAAFMMLAFGDVAASSEHRALTLRLVDTGLRESVQRHARNIEPPPLDDPALVARGLAHYRASCARCHGAPGVAPEPFALAMRPLPANLADAARRWNEAQLFRIVKHGIKFTGMPAWEFRLPDEELWAIVAFVKTLPHYTPQQYQALKAPVAHDPSARPDVPAAPTPSAGGARSRSTPASPATKFPASSTAARPSARRGR